MTATLAAGTRTCVLISLVLSAAIVMPVTAAADTTESPDSHAGTELDELLDFPANEASGDAAPAKTDEETSHKRGAEEAPVQAVKQPKSPEGGANQAPGTAAKANDRKPRTIEEIIVTATKREESIRDIPASIDAFDGADLELQGILSINDVLEKSPGVTINSARPGDQRVVVRGITVSSSPISNSPFPVGILIGDTAFNEPYAAGLTPDLSAFDLAAVEVLKGPQGTLFGGSALAGAIRYRLEEPSVDEWQLRGFSQYTSLNEGSSAFAHGLAANMPLLGEDGDLGLRVVYIDRDYPGVYDDIRPEQAQENVNVGSGSQSRVSMLWLPSDRWRVKLLHLEQDYEAPNDLVIGDSVEGPRETEGALIPWQNENAFNLQNLELSYEFDAFQLISSTSYTNKMRTGNITGFNSVLGTPPAGTPDSAEILVFTDQESDTFAQELRIQSVKESNFKWLAGVYYYEADLFLQQITDTVLNQQLNGDGTLLGDLLGGLPAPLDDLNRETFLLFAETNATAGEESFFFDMTYTLWDRLHLSVGARYYETFVDGNTIGRGILARAANQGMTPVIARNRIEEDGINPKLSVKYDFNDSISIYALASRGFRFGGIQAVPEDEVEGVPATYDSDSVWNYELGIRTEWLDNSLQFDFTLFYIDFENPQVAQQTRLTRLVYFDNVGAAVSEGFEASLQWLTPIDGLSLSLTGGVTDAYTTVPFEATGGTIVPAGTQLPGSADKQYNAAASYNGILWDTAPFGVSINYSYIGRGYNLITYETRGFEINDYSTVNLNAFASLPAVPGAPTLSLSVLNLKDELAVVGGAAAAAPGNDIYFYNPPRTFVARLGFEF